MNIITGYWLFFLGWVVHGLVWSDRNTIELKSGIDLYITLFIIGVIGFFIYYFEVYKKH